MFMFNIILLITQSFSMSNIRVTYLIDLFFINRTISIFYSYTYIIKQDIIHSNKYSAFELC